MAPRRSRKKTTTIVSVDCRNGSSTIKKVIKSQPTLCSNNVLAKSIALDPVDKIARPLVTSALPLPIFTTEPESSLAFTSFDEFVNQDNDIVYEQGDIIYFRLLEEANHSSQKALVPACAGDFRTLLYVVKDFDNNSFKLNHAHANVIIIRKVKCSDGFCLSALCSCTDDASRSLAFEDRETWTISEFNEEYGSSSKTLQGCRHRRAVLRLETCTTELVGQLLAMNDRMLDSHPILNPYIHQVPTIVKSFWLRRKDGVTGYYTRSAVLLGLRNTQLALGYFNGTRINCLLCKSSSECGHFVKVRNQLLAAIDEEPRRSKPVTKLLPDIQEIFFSFDPGLYSLILKNFFINIILILLPDSPARKTTTPVLTLPASFGNEHSTACRRYFHILPPTTRHCYSCHLSRHIIYSQSITTVVRARQPWFIERIQSGTQSLDKNKSLHLLQFGI